LKFLIKAWNSSPSSPTLRSKEDKTSNGETKMKTKIFTTRQLAAGICLAMLTASAQDRLKAPIPIHPIPSAPKKSYTPASVLALPGLQCKVYPTGSDASTAISVSTNDDGYARFHAVRASASDPVKQLTMDCTDSDGTFSLYTVDLTSADTFAARPLNIANERGVDRPALRGDPLSYSQAQLLQAGYGLRPDPQQNPGAYARWLKSASVQARMLEAKRPAGPQTNSALRNTRGVSNSVVKGASGPHADKTVTTVPGNLWTGSVLTGAPNYLFTEALFNVPAATPGGDETTGTWTLIWNGLGGNGTGAGLIQGGIAIRTNSTTASYSSFREYCCGDGISNSYSGNFSPNPGDEIYSQEWYCDASGNVNLNGGYGCSFIVDLGNNAFLNCTSATGSPCPSVPALPLCSVNPTATNCMTVGLSAEFVVENDSPQLKPPTTAFTDLASIVEVDGSALSSATASLLTVASDPSVTLLTDFTDNGSNLYVWLGTLDETYFGISQWAPVPGQALGSFVPCPVVAGDCYPQSIAVGPNGNGSTAGDPWALGNTGQNGDYYVYQWINGQWVQQPGAGTQIAISPQGIPWLINHLGQILYWDGQAFQQAPGNGCATSIGVGPNAYGSKYGDPWVIGCGGFVTENSGIYQLQGSTWVQQPGQAVSIAVSPQGGPWVVASDGSIYYWNGSGFTWVPGCATSIAVGLNTANFAGPNGDAWVIGCDHANSAGSSIYQLQNGSWVQIPGMAAQISVSPDLGIPWVVTFQGQIFR
jgi:hypothetical protein